jgi:predicted PurR-regulated permease PerM
MVSFMRFGIWGLLLAPVTLLVMVLVIAALDDR